MYFFFLVLHIIYTVCSILWLQEYRSHYLRHVSITIVSHRFVWVTPSLWLVAIELNTKARIVFKSYRKLKHTLGPFAILNRNSIYRSLHLVIFVKCFSSLHGSFMLKRAGSSTLICVVYFWQLLVFACRLSGVSPFQGETVEETCRNITEVKYEFNSKHFEPISQQGKDFISSLLVKNPK